MGIPTSAIKMEMDSNTTSIKQKLFIEEPMNNKLVTSVGGIGKVAAAKLEERQITKAYHLLGYFLTMDKDKIKFIAFLKENAGMTEKNAKNAADTFDAWCLNFL
jgi:hypothetical protein